MSVSTARIANLQSDLDSLIAEADNPQIVGASLVENGDELAVFVDTTYLGDEADIVQDALEYRVHAASLKHRQQPLPAWAVRASIIAWSAWIAAHVFGLVEWGVWSWATIGLLASVVGSRVAAAYLERRLRRFLVAALRDPSAHVCTCDEEHE